MKTIRAIILGVSIWLVGVVLVTVFGNVPLNEMIDKHHLEALTKTELKDLRTAFEIKWNQLHLVRTITSTLSFILLIIITAQFKI